MRKRLWDANPNETQTPCAKLLPALPSLLHLPEVAQIRRGLVPPDWHQQPLRAERGTASLGSLLDIGQR